MLMWNLSGHPREGVEGRMTPHQVSSLTPKLSPKPAQQTMLGDRLKKILTSMSTIFVDHLHVEGWQLTGLAGLRWKTEYKNNNSLLAVLKPPAGHRLSENPSPPCLSLIGDMLQANSVPLGCSRKRLHQIPFLPPAGGDSGSALPPTRIPPSRDRLGEVCGERPWGSPSLLYH